MAVPRNPPYKPKYCQPESANKPVGAVLFCAGLAESYRTMPGACDGSRTLIPRASLRMTEAEVGQMAERQIEGRRVKASQSRAEYYNYYKILVN